MKMNNFATITFIQIKLFYRNSYFKSHLILTCISMYFLLSPIFDSYDVYIRMSIFSYWTMLLTSIGIINYQRFQGTLTYLFNGQYSNFLTLISIILPISIFSCLAFIISLIPFLFNLQKLDFSISIIYAILSLIISGFLLSLLLSLLSIKTRNAIFYEKLIFLPLLFLIGYTGFDIKNNMLVQILELLCPIASPIRYLLGYDYHPIMWVISICVYIIIIYLTQKYLLLSVTKSNNLGEI